jgi:hypothetical protein
MHDDQIKLKIPEILIPVVDELIKDCNLQQIEPSTKDGFLITTHRNYGMYARNHYGLWGIAEENELVSWFNQQGITHADDMSSIIFSCIWAKLSENAIDLEKEIKFYQEYWRHVDD